MIQLSLSRLFVTNIMYDFYKIVINCISLILHCLHIKIMFLYLEQEKKWVSEEQIFTLKTFIRKVKLEFKFSIILFTMVYASSKISILVYNVFQTKHSL